MRIFVKLRINQKRARQANTCSHSHFAQFCWQAMLTRTWKCGKISYNDTIWNNFAKLICRLKDSPLQTKHIYQIVFVQIYQLNHFVFAVVKQVFGMENTRIQFVENEIKIWLWLAVYSQTSVTVTQEYNTQWQFAKIEMFCYEIMLLFYSSCSSRRKSIHTL